jgi:hypothetical protein
MTPEQKQRIAEIIRRDGPEVVAERVQDIITSAAVQQELDPKGDAEVADLLMRIVDDVSLLSPQSVLVCNAAERLRRAGGGPLV